MGETTNDRWPSIPVTAWADTRDTLHLYTQIVGKVQMTIEPLNSHWWNITFTLSARGLISSLMHHPTGSPFQVEFDFIDHRLVIRTITGAERSMPLGPTSVADFYSQFMGLLDELGLATAIWPMPVEIQGAIDFTTDHVHASYDPDAVNRFWRAMVAIEAVMKQFRTNFIGKDSPIHYFWGAIDQAYTRFSGRTAPPHPGGAPNCGPHVMWEAYSHEVSSCGYWPGGPAEEGIFYAYAYPDPPGYRDHPVGPQAARWDDDLGEFILPYEAVRTAADPEATLLEFLQSTYEAAAITAKWDRAALERPPGS